MTINTLIGKTLTEVKRVNDERIIFIISSDEKYKLHHDNNDCCEQVEIVDISGDLTDLIGNPILIAEENSHHSEVAELESQTWTFYRIGTIKGFVVIRWLGISNGYYSEDVYFDRINDRT